jgi:hypothetical protein
MKNQIRNTLFLFHAFTIISIFNLSAQVLTLAPGSHFVIEGNTSLVLNNAAINNNGSFMPGSGTVYFTGGGDTTLSFIKGNSISCFNNLLINKTANGVAAKSAVWVSDTLAMAAGILYANNNLTLKSTGLNTAIVAPVPINCSIVGNANVERYFPAKRSWRLITAPLSNSNTIRNSWQNAGISETGKGTFITGANPSISNGLDSSLENNYSMYSYNNSTQKFFTVDNTNVNVSQGSNGNADNTGYMLFVRGDRNPADLTEAYNDSTTISASGLLQTGAQTFTASSFASKYTLVGNPYASPIDFSNLTRANLINRFYVWDPYLNTVGGFVVLDDLDGDGIYTKSVAGSMQTPIIQSGQGFFVQTEADGAASLTINENNKSSIINNLAFRPASTTAGLTVTLNLLNADGSTTLADGAVAQFNDIFSDAVNAEDAPKLGNINEALSFLKYGKSLSIERGPSVASTDTLFLQLAQTTMRNYQLELAASNFSPSITGFLQDTYLGTSTAINLAGNTKVNFSISSKASADPNRFRVIFNGSKPLAVDFTTVKAYQKNTDINVEWDVQSDLNIAEYEVEKSSDGIHFTETYIVVAGNSSNSPVNYSWLDTNPFAGDNYYRIKSVGKDGSVKYSQIVKVAGINKGNGISVYPNPVTGNVMNIQFNNEATGKYVLYLINEDGKAVYTSDVLVNSNNISIALTVNPSIAKGSYNLKIIGPANKETIQKLIIQ